MNPHGWQDFGDFAADAGPGLLIFIALMAFWIAYTRGGKR